MRVGLHLLCLLLFKRANISLSSAFCFFVCVIRMASLKRHRDGDNDDDDDQPQEKKKAPIIPTLTKKGRAIYNELVGLNPLMVIPAVIHMIIADYADNRRLMVACRSHGSMDAPRRNRLFAIESNDDDDKHPKVTDESRTTPFETTAYNGVCDSIGGYIYHHYTEPRVENPGALCATTHVLARYHYDTLAREEMTALHDNVPVMDGVGCSFVNDRLYVGVHINDIYMLSNYDPVTDAWTFSLKGMKGIHGHSSGRCISINNRIYTCSGYYDTTTESVDPRDHNEDWSVHAPMPFWRQGFSTVATPNGHSFLVIGGSSITFADSSYAPGDCTESVEYDTRNNKWFTHKSDSKLCPPLTTKIHSAFRLSGNAMRIDNTLIYMVYDDLRASALYYNIGDSSGSWKPMREPFDEFWSVPAMSAVI